MQSVSINFGLSIKKAKFWFVSNVYGKIEPTRYLDRFHGFPVNV